MYYYIFDNEEQAKACNDAINGSGWFPLGSKCNGIESPDAQDTTSWCKEPLKILTGGYAIPAIPDGRFSVIGISDQERVSFFETHVVSIQDLPLTAFEDLRSILPEDVDVSL